MRGAAPIRRASAADWEAVAALHAASWRSAYRGIYPDSFLDGPVFEERRDHWRGFFARPRPDDAAFLAEDAEPVGFACIRHRFDPAGPLLDNLHVRPDRKGEGIGTSLLARAVGWLVERDRHAPLQLLVWEPNLAARGYYASLGGREAEISAARFPAGQRARSFACAGTAPVTFSRASAGQAEEARPANRSAVRTSPSRTAGSLNRWPPWTISSSASGQAQCRSQAAAGGVHMS